MSWTCHDMFTRTQKSSIFHEFHTSYWLIKYLNPKLISWDIINTLLNLYMSITKIIFDLKIITGI
jgi:hypothetical protein